VRVVECVKVPLVPVMTMGYVPGATSLVVVIVTKLLTGLLFIIPAGLGEKDSAMPAGIPVAVRFTNPWKPLMGATVTVALPCWLALSVSVSGATEIVKSGAGRTTSCAVLVTVPKVAERLAVVEVVTTLVGMGNEMLVWPSGIVTELGTVATTLSEERVMVTPPLGAGREIVTVPVEGLPPTIGLGATVKESSSGPVRVKEKLASWTSVPLVPRTVTVEVPGKEDRLPFTVTVEVAELLALRVTVTGLKASVTPFGRVTLERTTSPAKSFMLVTVIVTVPMPL
jgi:hypothetical protein